MPAVVLADLYVRAGGLPVEPPSKTTIWRMLIDTDAEAFDAVVGQWLMSLAGVYHTVSRRGP